jgi:hypothetical protein
MIRKSRNQLRKKLKKKANRDQGGRSRLSKSKQMDCINVDTTEDLTEDLAEDLKVLQDKDSEDSEE